MPGVFIIDGHRASQLGDENSSQDTARVMERWKELRALGNTILLIHHTTKANEQTFRGSQALIDQADHVLYFYPVRKPGQDDPVEFDDPDSLTYYLGTREKTRYRLVKVYVKRAGGGRFVLAGNPDDEKIGLMQDLLGTDGLTQRDFLKAVKDNLAYGKDLTLRLLKLGEDRGVWTVEKGKSNSRVFRLSGLRVVAPPYRGEANPTTARTKGFRGTFWESSKNNPTTQLAQGLSGDFDGDPQTRKPGPSDGQDQEGWEHGD